MCYYEWITPNRSKQTHKTVPIWTESTLFQGPQCDIKHSLRGPSATGTFTDPWVFPTLPLNLFALNSPQLCNMELWLLAQSLRGYNSAPLCVGAQGPPQCSPTLHSWNPLVTAGWPEALLIKPDFYLRKGPQQKTAQFPLCFATVTDTWVWLALPE